MQTKTFFREIMHQLGSLIFLCGAGLMKISYGMGYWAEQVLGKNSCLHVQYVCTENH